VLRCREQGRSRLQLDDGAALHHRDPVADLRRHPQIVGDEQHRQPKARLEVFQQVQHLRLHRDVERGDRFVGDNDFRLERKRAIRFVQLCSRSDRAVRKGYRGCGLSNATVEYPSRDNPARQVAEAHKKVFRKRLCELAAAMGARHPAVLGDALLLLIEGIYVTGQQSEDGPAQSALTAAKLLIDVSVAKA
jgi:hypothetical protein